MRLYTDNLGNWYGTQSDAKKGGYNWVEVDFPTDKQGLLEYLNTNKVGGEDGSGSTGTHKDPEPTPPPTTGITCSAYKPASDLNAYDVHDVVTVCDRKHLGMALGAIISRLHDELDTAVEILEVAS